MNRYLDDKTIKRSKEMIARKIKMMVSFGAKDVIELEKDRWSFWGPGNVYFLM